MDAKCNHKQDIQNKSTILISINSTTLSPRNFHLLERAHSIMAHLPWLLMPTSISQPFHRSRKSSPTKHNKTAKPKKAYISKTIPIKYQIHRLSLSCLPYTPVRWVFMSTLISYNVPTTGPSFPITSFNETQQNKLANLKITKS